MGFAWAKYNTFCSSWLILENAQPLTELSTTVRGHNSLHKQNAHHTHIQTQ